MSTVYAGDRKMHKHRDLIIAWANGAEIQYKSKEPFDDWHDCTDDPDWNETEEDCYFRIKPESNRIKTAEIIG